MVKEVGKIRLTSVLLVGRLSLGRTCAFVLLLWASLWWGSKRLLIFVIIVPISHPHIRALVRLFWSVMFDSLLDTLYT